MVGVPERSQGFRCPTGPALPSRPPAPPAASAMPAPEPSGAGKLVFVLTAPGHLGVRKVAWNHLEVSINEGFLSHGGNPFIHGWLISWKIPI